VFAATHDVELADYLCDVYTAVHFGEQLGPQGIAFDHRLRHGVTKTRNALTLLRLHGAPSAVVSRAMNRAALLDGLRSH